MPFNGSGAFTRLYNWVNDRNAAIKIRADRMDAEMDGFATGLSNTITRDGQSTISQDIPFNGKRITGLGDATAASDAMNRQSSDARYTPRILSKSATYTLLAADIGSLILATSTWTLTLLAAATAANGFSFRLKNTGTGVITIDPNASETINGSATIAVLPGQEQLVICDGSNWTTLSNSKSTARPTSPVAAIDMVIPAGCNSIKLSGDVQLPTSESLAMIFSFDNGATFPTGASDYVSGYLVQTGTTVAGGPLTPGANFPVLQSNSNAALVKTPIDIEVTLGGSSLCSRIKSTTIGFASSELVYTAYHGYSASSNRPTNLRLYTSAAGNMAVGTEIIMEPSNG